MPSAVLSRNIKKHLTCKTTVSTPESGDSLYQGFSLFNQQQTLHLRRCLMGCSQLRMLASPYTLVLQVGFREVQVIPVRLTGVPPGSNLAPTAPSSNAGAPSWPSHAELCHHLQGFPCHRSPSAGPVAPSSCFGLRAGSWELISCLLLPTFPMVRHMLDCNSGASGHHIWTVAQTSMQWQLTAAEHSGMHTKCFQANSDFPCCSIIASCHACMDMLAWRVTCTTARAEYVCMKVSRISQASRIN